MEGTWRGLAARLAAASVASALAVTGGACGDDESSVDGVAAVETREPERTFAPLIELAADDPYRPMSARWFIEHSKLAIAEDRGCADRVMAVGRTLPELHDEATDWIYPKALGHGPHYYRNPYDANCELDFDARFYTDQLTRPHDPGNRVATARPKVGFQLDLVDEARVGPRSLGRTPVYVERTDEGDGAMRLTYWTLFGMHAAPAGEGSSHEGDWERVDVLLDRAGEHSYAPRALQLGADGGAIDARPVREVPWSAVHRLRRTHPVVRVASGTHEPRASKARCDDCVRWPAWRVLANARAQLWYGFGGAWGEVGSRDATTGPLGPHGYFPPDGAPRAPQ